MESPRAGLDSSTAGRLRSGSAGFHRLGCATTRVLCATADRRARVERPGVRVVGCPEDRRACGSRGAVVVGAGLSAQRAGSSCPGAVELAGGACRTRARSVVTPGAGAARLRARA